MRVLASLVTRNDEWFIERCLESLLSQSLPVGIRLLDSESGDGTRSLASRFPIEIRPPMGNVGYCRGHNLNLEGQEFDYALLLNGDTRLEPDFVERLTTSMERHPRFGLGGGKLLRMDANGAPLTAGGKPLLDSTGIYFTRSQRHFDRGSGEPDHGRYDSPQLVFGITGAALMVRRTLYDDLGGGSGFLDEDFFAYREDADLAWRAQLRGWHALYEPSAIAYHFRRVLPSGRTALNPAINYHSVKNRYLMRRKNMDGAVRRRCFPRMWLRDLGILCYILAVERSSLGALAEVRRLRASSDGKRRWIQSRRLVPPAAIASWFSSTPVARPLPDGLCSVLDSPSTP